MCNFNSFNVTVNLCCRSTTVEVLGANNEDDRSVKFGVEICSVRAEKLILKTLHTGQRT